LSTFTGGTGVMLGLLSMPRLMLVFVPPEGTTIDGSGFLI